MGLDMYLHKVTYIGGQWVDEGEAEVSIRVKDKVFPIQPNRLRSVTEQVACWRKANQIHGWFVDTCADGEDNCQPVKVSDTELRELLGLCKYVKAHPDDAPNKLPVTEGFFFGSDEYDEWYWKGIKSGKGYFGHAMTWVVTGNDLTNWSDITFIEPQTDMVEVPIGYWNIPMNCDEVAFNYYFVHIENGKRYLRWTNLVKFRIENGVPILKSVNNDPEYIIITKRER